MAKPTRKRKKRYEFVTFETDIFEGPFTLPKMDHLDLKTAGALNDGNLSALADWLTEAGAPEGQIEAFMDLQQDEIEEFMDAWTSGQPVTVPKYSKPSSSTKGTPKA